VSAEDRRRASLDKLHDPNTADSMDVRLAIVRRMQAGEITLAEAQAELKRIKAAARRAGRPVWGSR
jgi:hypothetical protein